MIDYLQLLYNNHYILGEFDPQKVSGLTPQWFWDRQVSLIDFRGDLQIRSAENITFGFRVSILTASHEHPAGGIGNVKFKHVWIDKNVTVYSFALLVGNVHLQEGAIVAAGSVVRNMVVPPYTLVEGNPARAVAVYRDGIWYPRKKDSSLPNFS